MLPDDVRRIVARVAGSDVLSASPVGGGCISNATRVDTEGGPLFVKWSREAAGETFVAEAEGLRALRAADSPLLIPEPFHAQPPDDGQPGVMVMGWIEPGPRDERFGERLGEALAALHGCEGPAYGFDCDNFIGRLPQQNGWVDAWPAFFRERRIEPQVRRARSNGRWHGAWDRSVDALYARLDDLLPRHPVPSLVHGDLWSGNVLAAHDGRAALVDPAVYYGHREVDVAMTELFGGFAQSFYTQYWMTWAPEPGYEVRKEVYNLYHLINHLNHFGGGYAGAVGATFGRLSL